MKSIFGSKIMLRGFHETKEQRNDRISSQSRQGQIQKNKDKKERRRIDRLKANSSRHIVRKKNDDLSNPTVIPNKVVLATNANSSVLVVKSNRGKRNKYKIEFLKYGYNGYICLHFSNVMKIELNTTDWEHLIRYLKKVLSDIGSDKLREKDLYHIKFIGEYGFQRSTNNSFSLLGPGKIITMQWFFWLDLFSLVPDIESFLLCQVSKSAEAFKKAAA